MQDYEVFQEALVNSSSYEESDSSSSYMNSLNQSLALVLDEFYQNIKAVGVSAVSGEGCEELFEAIAEADQEYRKEYLPMLAEKLKEKSSQKEALAEDDLKRLLQDLNVNEEEKGAN